MIKIYLKTIEPLLRLIAMIMLAYFGFIALGSIFIFSDMYADVIAGYLFGGLR